MWLNFHREFPHWDGKNNQLWWYQKLQLMHYGWVVIMLWAPKPPHLTPELSSNDDFIGSTAVSSLFLQHAYKTILYVCVSVWMTYFFYKVGCLVNNGKFCFKFLCKIAHYFLNHFIFLYIVAYTCVDISLEIKNMLFPLKLNRLPNSKHFESNKQQPSSFWVFQMG